MWRSADGEVGAARVKQGIEENMSNERQLAQVRFLTVAEVASIMRVSKMTSPRSGWAARSESPRTPCTRTSRGPSSTPRDNRRPLNCSRGAASDRGRPTASVQVRSMTGTPGRDVTG